MSDAVARAVRGRPGRRAAGVHRQPAASTSAWPPTTSPARAAHVRGLARGRDPRPPTRRASCSPRSTGSSDELGRGHVRVRADRRGHPHRHRAPGHRAGRAGGRQAPHRPQPQRPGRHRPAAVRQARAGRRRRAACVDLQQVLLDRAARGRRRRTCPGYTHLQRAQPVLLAHHLLAHGWALARDVDRLLDTRRRLDVSPLGAGALAGSSLPLDPDGVAADLGFAAALRELPRRRQRPRLRRRGAVRPRAARRPPVAASARRSCCGRPTSSASSASTTPTPPAVSMLPQKKNPDIAELARGKAGPAHRPPHRPAGHAEGPAARVQPRPPGGQGAAVRRARPGRARPCRARRAAARPRRSTSSACRRRPTARRGGHRPGRAARRAGHAVPRGPRDRRRRSCATRSSGTCRWPSWSPPIPSSATEARRAARAGRRGRRAARTPGGAGPARWPSSSSASASASSSTRDRVDCRARVTRTVHEHPRPLRRGRHAGRRVQRALPRVRRRLHRPLAAHRSTC